ncbi:hypothetical protein AGLY_012372 [Aphis glycines]|uniref:PiggyBac transposable element-derived protein domain-containing protein n=1 Tax=Aphis glycines TaxID=307491 RepID=A0A6G0T9V5_APHGL|nr:hypothetical protein AGLY_012372 [Aphis glycines]
MPGELIIITTAVGLCYAWDAFWNIKLAYTGGEVELSRKRDFESDTDSVGELEIDELLENFDENETFELLDYNDIENVNDFPEVDVPGWFTIEKKDMKWIQKPFTPPKINLNEIEQSDCPDEIQSPLYYFSKYFDDSDFENISFFTNLYAVQKHRNNFKPTNTQEMKKFVSIHLMGVLKFPRTIRANRFCNPPFVSDEIMKNLGRGTTFEISSNVPDINIGLVKWYDNKLIYLCSNIVTSGEVDKVKRWDRKKKEYVYIERPEIVRHYNKTMGGVDKHDQLVSFYRCFIKSKKWTLRMVSHAFDMAVSNSWLEYVEDAKKLKVPKKEIMDLLNFRMRLAEELIYVGKTVTPPSKKKGRPMNTPSPVVKKKLYSETQKMMLVDSRPPTSVQHDSIYSVMLGKLNSTTQLESSSIQHPGC